LKKVFNEIGGNFWFGPDTLSYPKVINLNLQYVSKEEQIVYTSTGRSAIKLILQNLTKKNKKALLPIFTCDSVIKPFIQEGYKVSFYNVEESLQINSEHLKECIEALNPDIVFFQSYFGFATLQNIRLIYNWIKNKDIIIIEDLTHCWLSNFDKRGADYYLLSLRKWLEIPDGGAAICNDKNLIFKKQLFKENDGLIELFTKAALMKEEYTKNLDTSLKPEFRRLYYKAENLLDSEDEIYKISNLSKAIINSASLENIKSKRRNNFLLLLNNLKENSRVKTIFGTLNEEVVPLYFPVYVNLNRQKLQNYLAENEIYCPIHWPLPDIINRELTSNAEFIYKNLLSIPCDQRYDEKDMQRIVQALVDY